jgi:alkanesulfonate monooxygenase SsuD/methylene tetrahydromethanopterin reductase-like flavin-dependent oxidoreductase (luciferase family)
MTPRTGLLLLPTYDSGRLGALAEMAEATGYDDLWLADERPRFARSHPKCPTRSSTR